MTVVSVGQSGQWAQSDASGVSGQRGASGVIGHRVVQSGASGANDHRVVPVGTEWGTQWCQCSGHRVVPVVSVGQGGASAVGTAMVPVVKGGASAVGTASGACGDSGHSGHKLKCQLVQ